MKTLGAEFHRTNRGGLITFHGPGQLVVYPILDLKSFNKSMKWYICKLEKTVIEVCKSFGVEAERSSDTGVWVKDNKICAIGISDSNSNVCTNKYLSQNLQEFMAADTSQPMA